MKKSSSTKNKILQNQVTLGSWITFSNSATTEMMAGSGFDWLALDIEHTSMSPQMVEDLIRIIDLHQVTPLVRLTSNNDDQIKKVMDAGAHGIIVPMVNTKEEAEKAVRSAYYPPRGTRGVGLWRAQSYGSQFEQYKTWANENTLVIVQIEHIKAVENIEDILSVEGVDAFMVGPYDLSGSLGVPGQFDHPLFLEAMKKIKTLMKSSKKSAGFHIVHPDQELLRTRASEGYTFLSYASDMRILDSFVKKELNEIRTVLK